MAALSATALAAWWRRSGGGSAVVATARWHQLGGGVLAAAARWWRLAQWPLKLGSSASWQHSARQRRQLDGSAVAALEEENADLARARGMEAVKGATTWPTALDWILFPYLDNNGLLKP